MDQHCPVDRRWKFLLLTTAANICSKGVFDVSRGGQESHAKANGKRLTSPLALLVCRMAIREFSIEKTVGRLPVHEITCDDFLHLQASGCRVTHRLRARLSETPQSSSANHQLFPLFGLGIDLRAWLPDTMALVRERDLHRGCLGRKIPSPSSPAAKHPGGLFCSQPPVRRRDGGAGVGNGPGNPGPNPPNVHSPTFVLVNSMPRSFFCNCRISIERRRFDVCLLSPRRLFCRRQQVIGSRPRRHPGSQAGPTKTRQRSA